MVSRRSFIQTLSLAGASLALTSSSLNAMPFLKKRHTVGIQLWTLRSLIEKDLPGVLQSLHEIGYNSIEPFGFNGEFFGYGAAEFRRICDNLELEILSSHSSIDEDNATEISVKGKIAGMEFIVMPWTDSSKLKTVDDYKNFAGLLNRIGRKVNTAGLRFAYHNHNFEFQPIDGQLPYDIMLQNTDPDLVTFQMDIYWVVKGGQKPEDYFNKYPGRFESWHIKDMACDGNSCAVGDGAIDFRYLMKFSKKAGLKRFFVEQEYFDGITEIEAARKSYNYINDKLL